MEERKHPDEQRGEPIREEIHESSGGASDTEDFSLGPAEDVEKRRVMDDSEEEPPRGPDERPPGESFEQTEGPT